jgi:hypothetical protein
MNVVDDLATVLFELDDAPLATGQMTARITTAIVEWAVGRGWSVRTEARVRAMSGARLDPARGYMDVVVRRGGGDPDLAIEIDSADKPWSVDKLRHAAAGGMHAIWIRWGDDAWAGIYDDIDVIQLPILRRPQARHRPDAQLSLWPV